MTINVFNSSELSFFCKPIKHRRMRVADILLRDEDGDGGVRVIGRWLKRWREKKGSAGNGKVGKAKEKPESVDVSVPTRCSTNCSTRGSEMCLGFKESNDGSEPSGSCTKEAAFNLGVGFSLLYLIAHGNNELEKMTELRTQMESFLQVAKEELQRKDAVSQLSEPHDNVAYSTTDIPKEGSNSSSNLSIQFSAASYAMPESETILECHQDSPKPEYSVEGMIRLEEELEAELERLQLHLETETLSDHPQLQRLEVTVKDSAPVESHGTSSGEVIDPQEYNGVPPYILERRLHELLESRQEDHIRELEAALKCFQQKLHEKELELSWWKDRARLISQHAPTPSTSRFTYSP